MIHVSRVIISSGEKVLLGKRSSGIESGKWSIFGGKSEKGESPLQTAHREVFEETGLFLTTISFLFVNQFNDWESHCFVAPVQDENVPNLTEHDEFRFFSWEELELISEEIAFNHYLILKQYFSE